MSSHDEGAQSTADRIESGESFAGTLRAAVAAPVLLTIICCGLYPAFIWAAAQAVFPHEAAGSLLRKDGSIAADPKEAVGSALLAQGFSAPEYFHPRPSAAGAGYDGAGSGGSNLGPLSDKLLNGVVAKDERGNETLAYDGVRLRVLRYAIENGIAFESSIPLDSFRDVSGNLDEVKVVSAFPHAGDPRDKKSLVLSRFGMPIPGDAVTASGSGLDPHVSPANAAVQKARVAKARGIEPSAVEKLIEDHTDRPALGILGDPGINVLRLNLALDRAYPMSKAGAW
jgi:potassium-transporting ATPase KdpC subunit